MVNLELYSTIHFQTVAILVLLGIVWQIFTGDALDLSQMESIRQDQFLGGNSTCTIATIVES